MLLNSLHGHSAAKGVDAYAVSATTGDHTHFTKIDSKIDFDVGQNCILAAMIPTNISSYPTQYFSIVWQGYLKANRTALYRIYVESEESSFHELSLAGQVKVSRQFRIEGDLDNSSTTEIAGETYVDYWLEAEQLVELRLRYARKQGTTLMKLHWAADHMTKEIIDP